MLFYQSETLLSYMKEKTGKEYYELWERWEEQKKIGVAVDWKGQQYLEFKRFFGLKKRLDFWGMLESINEYLDSTDSHYNIIFGDNGQYAIFKKTKYLTEADFIR